MLTTPPNWRSLNRNRRTRIPRRRSSRKPVRKLTYPQESKTSSTSVESNHEERMAQVQPQRSKYSSQRQFPRRDEVCRRNADLWRIPKGQFYSRRCYFSGFRGPDQTLALRGIGPKCTPVFSISIDPSQTERDHRIRGKLAVLASPVQIESASTPSAILMHRARGASDLVTCPLIVE